MKKQTFEEALTSADSALPDTDTAAAQEREEDETLSESLTLITPTVLIIVLLIIFLCPLKTSLTLETPS